MNDDSPDIRKKRLFHRARYRGFREADLLFGGFAEQWLDAMNEAELAEFEALLSLPDQDIYSWVRGLAQAPANVSGPIFQRLQEFNIAAYIASRN